MSLTESDVRHVMSLARLNLPQEEVHKLTSDLQAILKHVDTLQQLKASSVASGPVQALPMREDVAVEGLGAKGLEGSAGKDGSLVRVPRIME
jgi:aspartyl-tRNA(Asn)/glutamyl-tRNA(Gln) amidotransferase subunit C